MMLNEFTNWLASPGSANFRCGFAFLAGDFVLYRRSLVADPNAKWDWQVALTRFAMGYVVGDAAS